MYSPKIREDLIPIIYQKAKLIDKSMTEFVDEILRSELIEDDEAIYHCGKCLMQTETFDNKTGYCNHCECVVFVEKA